MLVKDQGVVVVGCLLSMAMAWPLPPTEIMMCGESYFRHFEKIKRYNLCPWGKLQSHQGGRIYAQRGLNA